MNKYQVLIVEDDEAFVPLIQLALRDLNYEFDVVKDGQTALARLETNSYNLVISDYRLPYIHGLELLKAVKKMAPECNTVLITATDQEMIRPALKDLDLLAFIQKPVSPRQIRKIVTDKISSL